MKNRIFTILLCGVMVLGLTGCGKAQGNIKSYKIRNVKSQIYTKDEIDDAIKVATDYFKKYYGGCTLKEIYYSGDEHTKNYQDWADRNNADEVIVLLSTFTTGYNAGGGTLNPNDTYKNWNWILVRTNNGKWAHVDHGY